MHRFHIYALVLFVIVINSILIPLFFSSGTEASRNIDYFGMFWRVGSISTILTVFIFAFDSWLWKTPILYGWFVRIPNINGEWDISATETKMHGGTSNSLDGKMTIKQNFFTIKFDATWNNHGRSKSIGSHRLSSDNNGGCAFPSNFKFESFSKKFQKNYFAGIFFHSDEKSPDNFIMRYATADDTLVVISLNKIK